MLNFKSCLEVKGANERIYTFLAHKDAPLGECYDALQRMMLHILETMKAINTPVENQADCCKEDKCDAAQEG